MRVIRSEQYQTVQSTLSSSLVDMHSVSVELLCLYFFFGFVFVLLSFSVFFVSAKEVDFFLFGVLYGSCFHCAFSFLFPRTPFISSSRPLSQ